MHDIVNCKTIRVFYTSPPTIGQLFQLIKIAGAIMRRALLSSIELFRIIVQARRASADRCHRLKGNSRGG